MVWSATDEVRQSGGEGGPGAFVVLSGVVKRVYVRPDGSKKVSPERARGLVAWGSYKIWSCHLAFWLGLLWKVILSLCLVVLR